MGRVASMSLPQLERHHRELDNQLSTLTRRAYLTPDERRREQELKKLKLSTKDQIARIAARSDHP